MLSCGCSKPGYSHGTLLPEAIPLAAGMENANATRPAEIRKKRANTGTGDALWLERKRHCPNQQRVGGGNVSDVKSEQGRAYQQDTSSSSQSSLSPDGAQQLSGHPRPGNVTFDVSCNRAWGVPPSGSVEAGDFRGLGSISANLLAPQSPFNGTPLRANLFHGQEEITPETKVSRSGSSSSPSECMDAASGQPSSQALRNPSPLGASPRACTHPSSNEQALSSLNVTLSSPPLQHDLGLPLFTEGPKPDFHQRRGVKETPGFLLRQLYPEEEEEGETDPPGQEAQAQEKLYLESDDVDSSISNGFRIETSNFPLFHPRTPVDGFSSKGKGISDESQDAESDIDGLGAEDASEVSSEADASHDDTDEPLSDEARALYNRFRRLLHGRHSPGLNPTYAIEDEDDTESDSNDSGSDSGENSQVSNDEPAAQADVNLGDADVEESDDSKESNEILQTFTELSVRSLGVGAPEIDSDTNVSTAKPFIPVPSSDEESSGEEYFHREQDSSAEELSEQEVEYLSDVQSSNTEPVDTPSLEDINATSRRRLTAKERELVRRTREIGACVRCRFQKIKCYPDPFNPEGKCKTCKKFSKTSPKTIHRVPCLRLRISDVILYRSGGLNLTQRWAGIEMRDIGDRLDTIIVSIKVSQNLCGAPLSMNVVRFKPRAGDVTARYWTDGLLGNGKETFKKKELASYCLADIYDTAERVRQYTIDKAVPAFLHTIREDCESELEGGAISKTYNATIDRYMELQRAHKEGEELSQEDKKEMEILANLLTLWCAIQHTVGSLYIEGNETLGMLPETEDKSYPLYGKVSVPRMIVAQFDNLNYNEVLERYKEKLLRDVDWLFNQDKKRWWFTIYLIVFILLREASRMTADRYRHARANYGSKLRYSIPAFVESLHESCNNILTHWHYYNCDKWPKVTPAAVKRKDHFDTLAPKHLDLVRQSRRDPEVKKHLLVWKQYKSNNGNVPKITNRHDAKAIRYTGQQDKFDWDHPLYWVSQMFEKNWYSHPTYQREAVPNTMLTAMAPTVAAAC
ncbi:hypothetical protein F53441_703 [Fusarium austroafricanum]|uniref:Zn(2)-C6 fungal-type domain-containing protein n=1 Tax=Fusarium austroafricanum TaxID=2364996 RepID=A0A8H4KXE4_9HYPO|nr:hypothetical protein F53441_703 [Fusarium austroafricanum]